MKKFLVTSIIIFFSLQSKAQDYKAYIIILQSQWRLTDSINDTTIFYKGTLLLTRKYTYKVAHNASFFFKEGGSLQVYYGCHTFPSDPDQEYCTPVYRQWEFVDPKNMKLSYTDMGIYRAYKIESFSDEYITLVMRK